MIFYYYRLIGLYLIKGSDIWYQYCVYQIWLQGVGCEWWDRYVKNIVIDISYKQDLQIWINRSYIVFLNDKFINL